MPLTPAILPCNVWTSSTAFTKNWTIRNKPIKAAPGLENFFRAIRIPFPSDAFFVVPNVNLGGRASGAMEAADLLRQTVLLSAVPFGRPPQLHQRQRPCLVPTTTGAMAELG
jgi:hypothetical protein